MYCTGLGIYLFTLQNVVKKGWKYNKTVRCLQKHSSKECRGNEKTDFHLGSNPGFVLPI